MNHAHRPLYGRLEISREFARQVRAQWAGIESPGRPAQSARWTPTPVAGPGGSAPKPMPLKRPLAA
jgi:hypothetical protein